MAKFNRRDIVKYISTSVHLTLEVTEYNIKDNILMGKVLESNKKAYVVGTIVGYYSGALFELVSPGIDLNEEFIVALDRLEECYVKV